MKKALLPIGITAAAAYLLTRGWNVSQGLRTLEYINPKIKIGKIGLTGAELQMSLDLRNNSSANIVLQYFYGNINHVTSNGLTKIAGFTFNPTGTSAIVVKARTTTTVPFTVRISTLQAVAFIRNLVKAITAGGGISTMLQVDGSMFAAGVDIPVKFNYDVKSNVISGIGVVPEVSKWHRQ